LETSIDGRQSADEINKICSRPMEMFLVLGTPLGFSHTIVTQPGEVTIVSMIRKENVN
jgi:hypothetical protein